MKLDVEIDLDDVSGGTVQHKLREALAKNWGKVKDLFVSWDTTATASSPERSSTTR